MLICWEYLNMPIYEYRCDACGYQMEAMQKMADAPLKECPQCHKPELVKLVSAGGFRLSGSGWYETDFKSGAKKNVADSGGPSCGSGGCGGCDS
jgi:putative FmdB family regulatory protein